VDGGFGLGEIEEFGLPLDAAAGFGEFLEEEAFVVVLGIGEGEGVGADVFAEIAEAGAGDFAGVVAAADVEGFEDDALADHFMREAELVVEFEGAGLDDHGAGMFARAGGFGEDAEGDVAAGEGEGEVEAGGAGAGDEDWSMHGWLLVLGNAEAERGVGPRGHESV